MKKLVNGKVIEVDNIELFELAAEGLALQNTAVSNTADGLDGKIDSLLVRKYIKQYDAFFKSMPYPLYAIEDDIKYATLGNFIKSLAKEKVSLWVDRGLFIRIDNSTGLTIRIVNNTWGITYSREQQDNTSLELYKNRIGYKEYSWLLKKIINKESTANFYKEFMPEFVEACNNQPMVLKWELENILTFGSVPSKTEFRQNKIINLQTDEEYSLDIYYTGSINTDERINSWNLSGDNGINTSERYKQIKTYGFDSYVKSLSEGAKTSGKMEKCKITGLHNLFMQLCGLKSANEMNTFPIFEGIISDSNLVFTIDKRLFIAKSNRLSEPKDIAHGIELYTVENNKIYFTKSKRISDKVSKDILYSYNIKDGTVRLCKIIFSY